MKPFCLLAAVVLGTASAAAAPKADYIFYFIGDGMGMGPAMATQLYNKNILKNETPLPMMQATHGGWLQTYSASDDVTDSAAAGTALATGCKTRNSMLGMTPDTISIDAVSATLQAMGYGIGIVTSVAADDATPAAFAAHVPNRKMYYEIGRDIACSGYEFFAGAGLRGTKTDGQDNGLLDLFAQNDVQILRGAKQIADISSRRVLLLGDGKAEHNIGYTIDSLDNVLTLPMMTKTCIEHLEKYSPKKFFAMIEGGNIDHALHANDAGAAIKEIINFNEAIALAMDFYHKHPDNTLIIITADHDTGGMAYQKQGQVMANIDYQKVSKEEFSEFCKAVLLSRQRFDWEDMQKYLSDNLGLYSHIKLSDKQEKAIRRSFSDTFENHGGKDQKTLYASFNRFAATVFDIFNKTSGFAFTTTHHTANPVPLFVMGCGADKFSGALNNNSLAGKIILSAKGK